MYMYMYEHANRRKNDNTAQFCCCVYGQPPSPPVTFSRTTIHKNTCNIQTRRVCIKETYNPRCVCKKET